MRTLAALSALAIMASGCRPAAEPGPPGARAGVSEAAPAAGGLLESKNPRFDGIRADEAISLVGTEPFWGGRLTDGLLTYSTPENQAGESIAVARFAGNTGLGFSGALRDRPLDLAITPGTCSDGMSERSYPYTVTLKLGEEQRNGCAWTARQPFSGPANGSRP